MGAQGRTVVLHMLTWKVNGTSQTPPICFHSGLATVVRIFDEKAAGGGPGQALVSRAPPLACGFFLSRWPACCQLQPVAFGGLCSPYLTFRFPHLPVLDLKAQQMQRKVQPRDSCVVDPTWVMACVCKAPKLAPWKMGGGSRGWTPPFRLAGRRTKGLEVLGERGSHP